MHDLVTLGEVMLRLSVASPARFETARQLDVLIGGAEANVAAACARLGLRAAWVSALPANPWGERIRRELAGHGVDCAHVRMTEGARVGVYFLEHGVAPRPTRVLYDRRDSAFARLTAAEVDWAPAEARAFAERVLPRARYLFVGQAEARTVFGLTGAPEQALEAFGRLAPKATVVLLRGGDGSLVLDGGRVCRPRIAPAVQVVDPIGAGDAYVAGFLWAALTGRDAQEAADAGAAVSALKCATWGDIALVSPQDVADLLAGGPDVRR